MSRYSQSTRTIGLALLSASLMVVASCGDEGSYLELHHGHERGDEHPGDHAVDTQALSAPRWPNSVTYNNSATRLSQLVNNAPGNAATKVVTIPAGTVAYIDANVDINKLVVNGQLHCNTGDTAQTTREIRVATMEVAGLFQCGRPEAPYRGNLSIVLKHSSLNPLSDRRYRALIAHMGGQLNIFGDTSRAGRRPMHATATAGSNQLQIRGDLSGKWQINDEIGIAPSSYDGTQYEMAKIHAISVNAARTVTTLTLKAPLRYHHWGVVQRVQAQRGEVVLDHRTEVVNLNRHIVIASAGPGLQDDDTPTGQRGGHVMIHHNGYAFIDGAKFYRLGQAGILGRYPFHWHKLGSAPGQFVKNSVVHRSFQRCFVIHQTNQVTLHNNSCFDFRGHGFFLEDGNEIRNVLTHNIAIGSRFPSPSKLLLASDDPNAGLNPDRFPAVSNFWISNPNNKVSSNIAAGGVGTGFWNSFVPEVRAFNETTGEFSGAVLARPATTNTWEFNDNRAHSTLVGFTWDGAPQLEKRFTTNNPNNPMDRQISSTHYDPPQRPTFRNMIAFKNKVGIYFRGNTAFFDQALFADNYLSIFVAYNQIFRKTVILDKSAAYGADEDLYLYGDAPNKPGETYGASGVLLYDGPWELDEVDFINFDTSTRRITVKDANNQNVVKTIHSTPFAMAGGVRKFVNISKDLMFTPSPLRMFKTFGLSHLNDIHNVHMIRDIDGTLSGKSGALLISSLDNNKLPGLCTSQTQLGLMAVCEDYISAGVFYLPKSLRFVLRRGTQDGAKLYSPPRTHWQNLLTTTSPARDRFIYINTPQTVSYEALVNHVPDRFEINVTTEDNDTQEPPILHISGLTRHCVVEDTPAFSTLNSLKASTTKGYLRTAHSLYIKSVPTAFKGNAPGPGIMANIGRERFFIQCSGAPTHPIKYSAAWSKQSDGSIRVSGWMCNYGLGVSVQGQLRLGDQFIANITANATSEEAVSFACGKASNANHRFSYTIPKAQVDQYPGSVKLKVFSSSPTTPDSEFILPQR